MIGIYARVSTEEQAKRGFSLKEQIRSCREKAGQADEILEYVDEGLSGEFLNRPNLTKLREDLKEGIITKVICLDPDRLSRKLMNQLIVTEEIEKRAELIFVNGEYKKTPEGMLFYQMRGAIAEFEKAKITERMSRGRREKAQQGKVVRNFQIYGYDYDKESEQLIINEYEARIVKMIFELYTNPNNNFKGVNGIAKFLTAQGIPTKKRVEHWHRQVVKQILMNRVYIGEFYQNRWNTEGMISNRYNNDTSKKIKMTVRPIEEWILTPSPLIIEQTQFDYAQQLLKQGKRRWSGQSKYKYLLSGLLRCVDCGNTMTGRRQKNWGEYHFIYTDEKNTSGAKHKGCRNRIRTSQIDNQVWEEIQSWLKCPESLNEAEGNVRDFLEIEKNEITRLNEELIKNKKAKNRLLKFMTLNDDIDVQEFRSMLVELQNKELEINKEIARIQGEITLQEKNKNTKTLEDAVEYYFSKNETLSFEEKQKVIRMIVKEITVSRDHNIKIYTY
ncbi:recombinase family protein [Guptibacillus hwajinpoensis]|uniref:Site-specific DNA recombinase n=1 Tax=Guptibacillus hwajinpoensis TaxID=208199 RepID=A0ABU0JZN2_9BACL|nr:recombinase family protein [Alkalihalobacillus hemicentroti]MDQ0481524.1 site-specific DNA recombinase [Alkalihalobacillus hemicentroti]